VRLTDQATSLYVHGLIDFGRLDALLEEAVAHGDPDYEPDRFGLPPWRRRYGGPFCDAVVVDASVRRRRRSIRFWQKVALEDARWLESRRGRADSLPAL
jgi:hypothetical protein